MRNLATIVGSLTMALTLSGCPIWIERNDVHWECDGGCAEMCVDDGDCAIGYYCEGGYCNASWLCEWDGSCPAGYTCDAARDTCIPATPTTCTEDAECADGYCTAEDGSTGLCVTTGACTTDEECAAYGPGLACDDRGICAPDEGPCPDGSCGCTADSECTGGHLCIDSRCTDPSTICFFDFECGAGTCIDNKCHARCPDDSCPVGQACETGICMTPALGSDGCVYDEDCGVAGTFACINASCHPTCTDREDCAEGEACSGGVCRADVRPVRSCTEGGDDCDGGKTCHRGVCRMPCAAEINCADEGDMSVCDSGYCRFPSELSPECLRASDCSNDAFCIDGSCALIDF